MRFPAEENSLVYTVEKASSAGLLMTAASLRHSNADNISKKQKKGTYLYFPSQFYMQRRTSEVRTRQWGIT